MHLQRRHSLPCDRLSGPRWPAPHPLCQLCRVALFSGGRAWEPSWRWPQAAAAGPRHTHPRRGPGRLGPHCGRGSQVPHGGRGSQGRRRGRGGLASPLGPRFGSGVALRPSLPRAGPRPARRAPVGECGWMGGHENQGEAHPPSRAAPQSLSSSGDETAQPSAPAGGPCVSGSGTGTHGRQKAHRSPGGVGLNATRQNQCPERSLHTHHWRA